MKYRLAAHITVSTYTEVEADSLEEAIAEAEGRSVSLGGIASGAYPEEVWVIDDADGEPTNIRPDEED